MVVLLFVALTSGCSANTDDGQAVAQFDEHHKKGELSLVIVGDYFHHSYVLELAQIAKALSPRARQIFLCTEQYKRALDPFLGANGVENVVTSVLDPSSPLLTQWARDVAVSGTKNGETTIVVTPDKHATSKEDAEATCEYLKEALPGYDIRIAPFVFEGGNLAFVRKGTQRILIIGRKVLVDNAAYQKRPWAGGYDQPALLDAMAETFGVDHVIVVGLARDVPAARTYFEYHIDMGMVVLSGNRAVVSRLEFGDADRETLASAIRMGDPVVTPFLDSEAAQALSILSDRLHTVAKEYEDYATVLDSLGVDVYRSTVDWQHVLASMSWTNVLQVGNRILMPIYPDSLRGITESMTHAGGQTRATIDVSEIGEEKFELRGLNERNRRLYEGLGYDVVTVPEYLHYMMGGVHCFVNVLE